MLIRQNLTTELSKDSPINEYQRAVKMAMILKESSQIILSYFGYEQNHLCIESNLRKINSLLR